MEQRSNLVLISMDAVRADALSCYGHPGQTTPFLDSIAQNGLRFTQCFANAPWTPPSHGTMLTGRYPSVHGIRGRRLYLNQGVPTLAEQLRACGYETVGISPSPWLGLRTGLDKGFDVFFHLWQRPHPLREPGRFVDVILDRCRRLLEGGKDGACRNQGIVRRWIRSRRKGRPFFLFLHYMGGHAPYFAPRPFARRFGKRPDPTDERRLRDLARKGGYSFMAGRLPVSDDDWAVVRSWYDAKIACLDDRLARLLAVMEEGGLLQNTVVAFTSDHGENFGEHGLAYHDFCLYDTLLHVPFLLYGSPIVDSGRVLDALVSHIDVAPTFLSLAGVASEKQQYPGHNLLSTEGGHEAVFAEYGPPRTLGVFRRMHPDFDYRVFDRELKSIRTARWKYIRTADGQEQLYDIAQDPRETVNRAGEMPGLCLDLQARIECTLPDADGNAEAAFEGVDYTPREEAAIMARLRELGYA